MNSLALILAFVMLIASCMANRYGFPNSYEKFLERQGVWDSGRHDVRDSYRSRKSYERDLRDLFEDWKRQTKWGQKDYRSNRFNTPTGGFGRYGFSG